MRYFIHQTFFVFRLRFVSRYVGLLRRFYFSLLGMRVGKGTVLPSIYVTWPHQVRIGSKCNLEPGICFKYDGIWKMGPSILIGENVFIGFNCEFNIQGKIEIRNNTLIASGCKFIDHDHGISSSMLMRLQQGKLENIIIGADVWIGCNCVILKGVNISDGAIIGAGSVLTKPVPPNEIWAGVPARKIGERK